MVAARDPDAVPPLSAGGARRFLGDRRQLEYFVTVAECGSISAAARLLGVSQPAVSQAIGRVEAQLGAPLLRRGPGRVTLTQHGRSLVGPAADVLRGFEAVDAALAPYAELSEGRLVVACPPTLARDPMVPLVARYRTLHPRIMVTILGLHAWTDLENVLLSGRAEVGVGVRGTSTDALESEHLVQQRIIALLPPGIEPPDHADPRELLRHGLVTTPRGGATRQLLTDRVGEHAVDDAITVETTHQGSMVPLVLAGAGVAFVSEAFAVEARSVGVRVCFPTRDMLRELWLLHRPRTLSPAASAFLELAREMRAAGDLSRMSVT